MGAMASQITSLTMVYSTVYSDTDQRKHRSSASLAFVRGIHRGPVNSRHKWRVTRKMFPFDDVIMVWPRTVKDVTFGMVKKIMILTISLPDKNYPAGLISMNIIRSLELQFWMPYFTWFLWYMNVLWHGYLILISGHVGDIFVIGCTRCCCFPRNQ